MSARPSSSFLLIGIVSFSLAAFAQEPDEEEVALAAIVKILRAKKVTFEYTDAPFKVVVDHIARETGVNFVVDPQVISDFECEGRTVNLKLKELAALDALQILLRFNNLSYTFRDGALFVTTPEGAMGAAVSVTYNVDSLCRPPVDNPGKIRDLFRAFPEEMMPPMMVDEDEYAICPEDLIDMIRESVAPDTWDCGEYRIVSAGRLLIVSHTREVHREIRQILSGIRALQGPAIAYKIHVLRLPASALRGISEKSILTAEDLRSLEKTAGENGQNGSSYRITGVNGSRTHIDAGREVLFQCGVDRGEPCRGAFRDGVLVDVRPLFVRRSRIPTVVRILLSSSSVSEAGLPSMPFLKVNTVAEIPRNGAVLLASGSDRAEDKSLGGDLIAVFAQALPDEWPDPSPPRERPDPQAVALEDKLKGQRTDVDYVGTDLKDVLTDLSRRTGVNIIVSPNVYEEFSEDELQVTLTVKNLSVAQILNLTLQLRRLAWLIQNGTVLVTTLEGAQASASLRHYPVHDLLFNLPDFEVESRPFPKIEVQPAPDVFMEEDEEPITGDTLVCMIRELIAPESWDTPPNQIWFRQNHLVARNQSAVLDRIVALLEALREKKFAPVTVEGVFLNAPASWLDRLDLKGPSLSPAQCDAVEKALEADGVRRLDRFFLHGNGGRRFCASGGRQVAYVNLWQSAEQYDMDAVLDGWTFESLVLPGIDGKRLSVEVSARITAYAPPGDPKSGAGQLASTRFSTDLLLEDGGGALLGSTYGGKDAEARCLLFLRVRRLK